MEWIAAAPLAGASAAFLVGLTPGLLLGIYVGRTLRAAAAAPTAMNAVSATPALASLGPTSDSVGQISANGYRIAPAEVNAALDELAAALDAARQEAEERPEERPNEVGALQSPLHEANVALERAGAALDRVALALDERPRR